MQIGITELLKGTFEMKTLSAFWLEIGLSAPYVYTAMRIETAEDLCREFLKNIVTEVLFMTGNEHGLEEADPLELAEIKQR